MTDYVSRGAEHQLVFLCFLLHYTQFSVVFAVFLKLLHSVLRLWTIEVLGGAVRIAARNSPTGAGFGNKVFP